MAEMQLSEFEKTILDSNARWMMENNFDKSKVETIVEATSRNLSISENKAKALLTKTIKDILAENSKDVLEELKPSKKKRKEKANEEVKQVGEVRNDLNNGDKENEESKQ